MWRAKGLARLGGGVCFFEGDEAGGEVEEGEVVVVLFRPADEQAAVAVHPGVTRFDDPAPRAPAGGVGLEADLFAAAADVGRVAVLDRESAHWRRVIAAV